jgi:phage portal protein BeeE
MTEAQIMALRQEAHRDYKESIVKPDDVSAVGSNYEPEDKQASGQLFSGASVVSPAGRAVNAPRRGTAELIAAYRVSPWLRTVVAKIATRVASVPWQVFRRVRNGRPVRDSALQSAGFADRQKMMARLKQAGEIQEIPDHPLLDLLNNANPALTGLNARKLTQIYLDLPGESFWILERNGRGRPVEYWPIPPAWVSRFPELGRESFEITFQGMRRDVPADDMLWFRDPDPADPYRRGVGAGLSLADEIETDEAASRHIKRFFLGGARPDMLVAVEGASKEQLQRGKKRFEQDHLGVDKSHGTFWHNGKMKVEKLQQEFRNMQMVELRKMERDTFITVFGVPPEIVGVIENSNRATIASAEVIMAREVVVPRVDFIRAELQMNLVPMFDSTLILGFESPVPSDREFQLEARKAAPWASTRGEWRELGGLPDRGNPDNVHLVPLNLLPQEAPSLPEIRSVKGVAKRVELDDIDQVLAQLQPERLSASTRPVWDSELEVWAAQVADDLGVAVGFDLLNPVVVRHLEQLGERIAGITDTTRETLRGTLIDGVRAGEGVDRLAARVRETMEGAGPARSRLIARTEVLTSSNFGTTHVHRLSGVVAEREWVTTLDGNQRETHDELDGQRTGINDEFTSSSGDTADHPGGFSTVEENANCRCTTIAVVEDVERTPDDRAAMWKAFDRRLIRWERAAEAAVLRAFEQQTEDIIQALREANRA